MESWLDAHPDFFQNYFLRKGTRSLIDSWLHLKIPPESVLSFSSSSSSSSTSSTSVNSGSSTPVRKISAHEFENRGLPKPLMVTSDGGLTFLSSPSYTSNYSSEELRRRSRVKLNTSNESELIFELVKDICHDLDVRRLCHKILQNVGILLHADRCSLFLVEGDSTSNRTLVSNLFDVSSHSNLEELLEKEDKLPEIRIPWGSGIVGHVAQSGCPLNIPDAYSDERFNQEIDNLTGYRTQSILCSPIQDPSGTVIGVAQVINKAHGETFTSNDESVFEKYLQFAGIGLRNATLYERSQYEVKRNQVLLDLAGVIFQEQSTMETMISRILTHMISLIRCERALLVLLPDSCPGALSKVFELQSSDLETEGPFSHPLSSTSTTCTSSSSSSSYFKSRFPSNSGITSLVASSGETINIRDAHSDPRFDASVDENSTFKHKTLLLMPIKYNHRSQRVLGVFQLINKFNDLPFTENDENFVEAFALFCGMGIHNVINYERTVIAMAKQQVTLEVLSYHASAPVDEAIKLSRSKVPSSSSLHLLSFSFDDFGLKHDETLLASLRMFIDLNFVRRFHMDYLVLCRWLTSVRKNYRNVTYHNWRHAFNVAQIMFALLSATQWFKKLGDVESLSLLIACLCHDLDHRGTNNSFQIKSSSNLAQLYSTSTMEHHHFDQCLMILNSTGNQILQNITQDEFKHVLYVLEDAILATDLALYFRQRDEIFKIIQSESLDFCNKRHRSLFRGLLMTACDLGAITKPWPIQQQVAKLVSDEFFHQGDLEKEKLNLTPIDIMNRDKENKLPGLQVEFINSICLPVYESMSSLSSSLSPLHDGCLNNRAEWLKIANQIEPK